MRVLPIQQRKDGFNPPTQGSGGAAPQVTFGSCTYGSAATMSPAPAPAYIPGASYSSGKAFVVPSSSSRVTNSGTFTSMQSIGSHQFSSGYQVPKTPAMLYPATPSPVHNSVALQRLQQPFGSISLAPGMATAPAPATTMMTMKAMPTAAPGAQIVYMQMPMSMPMAAQGATMAMYHPMHINLAQAVPAPMMSCACGGRLPSKGSALHGTGHCNPCAWFWKPGRGCQAGLNCEYCHLCSEGELKMRKKAKIAAIRRGEQ